MHHLDRIDLAAARRVHTFGGPAVTQRDTDLVDLALDAQKSGYFDAEIAPVTIAQKKGGPLVVAMDEHPRDTSLEALAKLKGVVRSDGTVTAGKASGVNDGACALLLASEAGAARHGLTLHAVPVARRRPLRRPHRSGFAAVGVGGARAGSWRRPCAQPRPSSARPAGLAPPGADRL